MNQTSWKMIAHAQGQRRLFKETRLEFKKRVLDLHGIRARNAQLNHWRKESAH